MINETRDKHKLAKLSKLRLRMLGIKIQIRDILDISIISSRDVGNFQHVNEEIIRIRMIDGRTFTYKVAPLNEFSLPYGPDLELVLMEGDENID